MPTIRTALEDFNPWWKEGFSLAYKPREIYEKIQKFMLFPHIIALTGLRRVGKTTLLFKVVVDALQEKKLEEKNIIYFSFDEFKDVEIRTVLQEYQQGMEKDLRKGKYLLLLDEVQKLSDWENQLKVMYDLYGKQIKIIISGSESLFIRKQSRETLAGRLFEFVVYPLNFKEFLHFQGISFTPIGIYERELLRQFQSYILTQGFPELLNVKDKEALKKYLHESIIEKIIYKDIPQMFKIKDISVVRAILDIFMEDPGQQVELSTLASELQLSRPTLSLYLGYLEKSFLIRKLYNFSRNKRKSERKLKKYYPAIISVDLLFKEDDFSRSRVFEWLLVNQLRPDFFWRDPYRHEVDMVLTEGDSLLPVEIKFGKIELEGMFSFLESFKVKKGAVLSWNEDRKIEKKGKEILVIPAYKKLLG